MRFEDSENEFEDGSEIIAWRTNEAVFLPIYLIVSFFAFLWTIINISSGKIFFVFFNAVLFLIFGWRSLRAFEQNRNLKKLHEAGRDGVQI